MKASEAAASDRSPKRAERSPKGGEVAAPGRTRGMVAAPPRGKSEKKGLGGLGSGIGISSSSRKPPLQVGQRRSEEGEGEIETVWLHWWQKYWRGSPEVALPPLSPPAEDMSRDKREREREREERIMREGK